MSFGAPNAPHSITMKAVLFRHYSPSELLASAATLKESESGMRRVGLLPANSKTGPSLSSVSGLKGQALKRWKRERQTELKTAMSKEFIGLAADPQFLGRGMTVSKSGVVGFFLEPSGVPADEAKRLAEAEERSKALEAEVATLKAQLAAK